ncbi:helix-turn-helix transcriptional regulator [Kitasatospora sp. RB6PN24]|uniref:helix-turn-helix domain-containing protein n=1 Tax=Kitasatospora humi TaxID=2893891 RepID=UPI001E4F4A57|nr:helix-turn-helix transcriptional regulator [Kitasatospora humi]MCC9312293.1 helix-turn-helix transcriptional regulator [Kitasatospora humi]
MELHEDDDKATPRTMLGRRLRRMREAADLSLRGLADQINFPHTYIGRVERGEQLPSEALAQTLDEYFKTDDLFVELLDMAHDTLIVSYGREFVAKEREALRIQVFTSSLIPGLLQTEAYARELFRYSMSGYTPAELDARVAARMNRKKIFNRDDPPLFWAIVDESGLRRPTSDRETMRIQLEHVLELSESPHITVQVLPFQRALHPMLGGSLTLLTMRGGETVGLVESFDSGESVDSPKRIVELVQGFDVARSMALTEAESRALVSSYLKEYADDH